MKANWQKRAGGWWKLWARALCGLATLCVAGGLANGAAFQNLNFEEGPIYPPDLSSWMQVERSDVMPGWTVRSPYQQYPISNTALLDYPSVSLIDRNAYYTAGVNVSYAVLEGERSLLLQAEFNAMGMAAPSSVGISQVGDIPLGTESLFFKGYWGGGQMGVSINGTAMTPLALSTGNGAGGLGVSVGQWAGQTVELYFWLMPERPEVAWSWWHATGGVDAIRFSVEAIPEPTSGALLLLGGLMIVGWRRVMRKR